MERRTDAIRTDAIRTEGQNRKYRTGKKQCYAVVYGKKEILLDEHTLYLDGSLQETQIKECPYVFRDICRVLGGGFLRHGTEKKPMRLLIAPGVYWIAQPGSHEVLRAREGDFLPYEWKVSCRYLSLEGLGEKPEEVVIAADKGQSHGCVGNYTMFHFEGDGLHLENLTLGNYCNVDLDFPGKPEWGRKKRTAAVTQAQIGDVVGDRFSACRCRFVSRLNLYPVCGAKRSLYYRCHFECTDDSLNGNAVYYECDFDFYGGKPIGRTEKTGSVFLDCRFRSMRAGEQDSPEQYFTKTGGGVILIGCRMEAEEGVLPEFTQYPSPSMKCYVYDFRCNHKPRRIGMPGRETVELEGKAALAAYRNTDAGPAEYNIPNLLAGRDGWDPLDGCFQKPSSRKEASREKNSPAGKADLQTGIPTWLTVESSESEIESPLGEVRLSARLFYFDGRIEKELPVFWKVKKEDEAVVLITPEGKRSCVVKGRNSGTEEKKVTVTAYTREGLEGAAEIWVRPAERETPEFLEKPRIVKQKGSLKLEYTLDLKGAGDDTDITWYRHRGEEAGRIPTAVSRSRSPLKKYSLSSGDIGYEICALVRPGSTCSKKENRIAVYYPYIIREEDVQKKEVLHTDFADFPTRTQPVVLPGFWTVDAYEPLEKETFGEWRKWVRQMPETVWKYGSLGSGCTGYGLYPVLQGAKLLYTPGEAEYGDMKLELAVDPAKTGGQGFGSAGQYMDVCLKTDTESLTGYALRIQRTAEASDRVAVYLVRYENGCARPLSGKIMTSCFRTGCRIILYTAESRLYAHICRRASASCSQAGVSTEEVNLWAPVKEEPFGGAGILFTGTTGDEGWHNTVMLHEITIAYSPSTADYAAANSGISNQID